MRIAQIVKTPQRRGAEVFALDLSRELERRGHETVIFYLYAYEGPAPLPLRPQDRVLGTSRPLVERFPGFQPGLLRKLRRALGDFRPDVVQTNGSRSVKYGSLARRLSRRSWALVARVIGSPSDWAGGALKRRLYARLVLSVFDGVIAVSRDTLEGLERSYGLRVPAEVIPRGVDPKAVRSETPPEEVRRSLGAGLDDPVLLYLGSLTPEKRPDRLLRVFTEVRRELPSARLWIAGSGPLEGEVLRQVEGSGLADSVSLLGTVAHVGDLLGAADLLVLTSDTEGTPGAVLEAGLAGLPVVATRVGGVPECVLDGRTGLLAAAEDEGGLAAVTVELLRDPGRRRSLGESGRGRVREHFSMERAADEILTFYRERRRPSLLVAEPQFKGPAHSTVNAALLEAARLAFAEARPTFLGPQEHGRWVRRALETTPGRSPEGIDWRHLPELPSLARVGRRARLAAELGAWRCLLRETRRLGPEALLICSVTRTWILLLTVLAPLVLRRTPVLVVVHQLNELLGDQGGTNRAKRLANLLTLPGRANLRFLAPAEPVFRELRASFPRIAARFSWIDLPYFWQEDAPTPLPASPGALVFGFFGVGRTGRIEPFCSLAVQVQRRFPAARFVLVGHLDRDRRDLAEHGAAVEGLDPQPLSLEALRERARRVHYAVWTSPEEGYRMTLSASFLDALSFVTPCIFLGNPFVAHYWEAMGEIGFRCRDLEEMAGLVAELLEGRHTHRYAGQCRRILDGRQRFAPERAGEALRRVLER